MCIFRTPLRASDQHHCDGACAVGSHPPEQGPEAHQGQEAADNETGRKRAQDRPKTAKTGRNFFGLHFEIESFSASNADPREAYLL